ncbi:MAG: alpha/beta hydrolase [Oscillospiraceae bacterium]|jgi:pimeloyl-ACP methyl ester carboxylesterase|nr:alpha/beta hydrolase [Oscillospiraceae bacterium]
MYAQKCGEEPELEKLINGQRIAYTENGEGTPVFLLHGWGASGALFARTAESIARKYRVICPDFPGFGASPEPPSAWDVSAYAEFTRDFIASFGCGKVILLGHSFGGGVILKMLNLPDLPFNAEKIILTGCAGIRHAPSPKAQKRVKLFKAGKALLSLPPLPKLFPAALPALQKLFGSADYAAASILMRQVLVKTVNEDLRGCMPGMNAPTLLLWGQDDPVTPLADGQEMERLIPGAGLAALPGAGHFAFIDQVFAFNRVLESFLDIEA